MKLSFSILLLLLATIAASAQFGSAKGAERPQMAPGRILVKLAGDAPLDPASLAATPTAIRFGVTGARPWLPPALVRRPQVDTRNGVQHDRSPSDSRIDGLSRILLLEYSADIDPVTVAGAFSHVHGIEYAEPIFLHHLLFTPNDQYLGEQWYLDVIHASEAWELQRADSSIVIAIVDTGIEKLHEDLRDAIWTNAGESGIGPDGDRRTNGIDDDNNGLIDDWWGYDFGGFDGKTPDNDPSPGNETHGTHVAGTAGASGNNTIGITGIAFGCRLMAVKTADDRRNPEIVGGFAGILYAARMGADIINCSWGGDGFSRAEQEVIDVVIETYGAVVVAAGGNADAEEDLYPAAYRGVISVGAVTIGDAKASFSNYSRTISIAAPGTSIYSTAIGGRFAYESGTSQATPIVSGSLGLVKRRYPTLDPEQLIEVVRASSDDISGSLGAEYATKLGSGRLDLKKALSVGPSIASARVVDYTIIDADGDRVYEPGEKITIRATVRNILAPSAGVTATLATVGTDPVQITNPVSALGAMATGMSVTTPATDFIATIPSDLEGTDRDLEFAIAVTTEGRTNTFYFTIRILPTYLTTAINNIGATFNSIGNVGYNGLNRDQGDGFTYGSSKSFLYHGGLLVGTDSSHLSDVIRIGYVSEGTSDGFRMVSPYRLTQSPDSLVEIGEARFSDLHRPAESRVGIEVELKTYERHATETDNFVLAVYRITNVSGHRLDGLHAGLYLDWDIGDAGADDRAGYDLQGNLGYVANLDVALPWTGAAMLSGGGLDYRGLDNYDTEFDLATGFSPGEKWRILSGGLYTPESPVGDVGMMIGSGPLSLDPGGTAVVAFALLAAPDLDSLRATAGRARAFYTSIGGTTHVASPAAPADRAAAAHPNPFDRMLLLDFTTIDRSDLTVTIYNLQGEALVRRTIGSREAGRQKIELDLSGLEPGAYFYRIDAGGEAFRGSVVKVK
jgi:subtilisin family serine protease